MVRKVMYPAVFVFVVLMASSALAGWDFIAVDTATPSTWGVEGRIFENDGSTLVQTGALVQFILDTDGDGIDDPFEFFDFNDNGVSDVVCEQQAVSDLDNAGADPSAFSDDQLLTAANWDGQTVMTAPGEVLVYPFPQYDILNGNTWDKFGWRAWNLTPGELDKWCNFEEHPEMIGVELWYGDGREYGTYLESPSPHDTGWAVGAPNGTDPQFWIFAGTIGYEVYMNVMTGDPQYRSQNTLDKYMGTCIPEPGTMLLIGSAVLLLLIRRKK